MPILRRSKPIRNLARGYVYSGSRHYQVEGRCGIQDYKRIKSSRLGDSLVCNNYIRPRCTYSRYGVSHMKWRLLPQESMDSASFDEVPKYRAMAKERLLDAMGSTIFMDGMGPLNLDDPYHDIYNCDPYISPLRHTHRARDIKIQDLTWAY